LFKLARITYISWTITYTPNPWFGVDLGGCSNLQELPTSIGQLIALREFNLSRCYSLQELPTSISQLNALQKLHLSRCSNLQKLPMYIGQLNAFQSFICEHVWTYNNYLHLLRWIECIPKASFVEWM
jgi:hypothetical protein